ncbi:hypothetical protein AC1031_004705 [Aphanomyces cochlioides]|nr:hypothetical protein AC1031_004705 [Aphanomyces cochlioides]
MHPPISSSARSFRTLVGVGGPQGALVQCSRQLRFMSLDGFRGSRQHGKTGETSSATQNEEHTDQFAQRHIVNPSSRYQGKAFSPKQTSSVQNSPPHGLAAWLYEQDQYFKVYVHQSIPKDSVVAHLIQAGAINVQELENGVIQVVCGRNQLGAVAESMTQFGIRPYDHLVMSNRNKLSAGVRKTIERSYVYALTAAVGTSPYLYYLLTTSSSTGQSMDKISMAVAGLWFGSMVGGIVVPKVSSSPKTVLPAAALPLVMSSVLYKLIF